MNTKKSLYRLLKIIDLIIIFVFAFGSPIGTLATVWTDQSDYSPGSVVTISGDNSNGIGYQPTEIVHVDVVGPNGYTAACEGVAADDANAAWSCQVTLWDSLDAVGTYTYTSLGLTSLVTETGTFTDAVGDFSIDFVAAAPYSYNHLVGGGAFDDRTVGKNADIVESLEAVDFACGDIVTFLAQIVVDDTERAGTDAPQTIELDFEFLMDTTGASGVAIGDITYVGINYAPIVDLIAGEDNIDQGNKDDGGSVATLIYENQTGPMFTPKSVLQGTVQITDLERNEEVIVRVDTRLYCQPGSDPTGNLQGAITAGRLTYIKGNVPVTPPANISVGNQTVPFLQFGNLQWPDIDIQKTVTSAGGTCPGGESLDIASGDTVKYCYVVSNTGTASMYDVTSVTDDNRTPGDTSDDFTVTLTGLTDVDGDGQMDDLAAGGTAYGEALVTVTAASTGTYTNVGTVSGFTFPNDTTQPLTDSDTASVVVTFVPMPAISIVKTTNGSDGPTILIGQPVNWDYLVTNTGNVELTNVSVTDDQGVTVTCPQTTLAVGASMTCTASGTAVTGNYSNIGTASGDYGGMSYTASDPSSYFGADPKIDIQKTPDTQTVIYGQTANFTIVVTNIGNVPLTNVTVSDPLAPNCDATIGDLAVGASSSYNCSLANVTASFTNVATASGDYGTTTVTDNDDAAVVVDLLPDISVTKTGNPTSVPETGGNVTFTYVVTNNSSEDATIIALSDDKFGTLAGDADCAVGTVLAGGASCTFDATFAIPAGDYPGSHVNVFSATAQDPQGNTDTATDDETITYTDVLPDISVTKTGVPTSIPETGGSVTFTYVVTNNSSEDATITDLSDDKFGLLAGDTDCQVGTVLAAGASCSFEATFSIPAGDYPGSHINVFTATAADDDGNSDTATDDETITYTDVAPAISITKTADPTHVPETGGDVTITFVVSNVGVEDVTLTSLTDTVFGDLNGQGNCATGGLIAVGGSYTCSITVNLSSDSLTAHTNVVTAVGTDDDGTSDTATDDETVTFDDVAPDISITKTASPTLVPETGGDVTFTFLVENIGVEDVTLTSLSDSVFGDLNGQGDCVTGGLIPVGGSYTCSITVFLSSDSLTPHTNVVTAIGTDDDGTSDTATDDETISFTDVAPLINVTKWSNPTSVPETGANVTFTFRVDNTGQEDVTLTSLVDTVFGDLDGKGTCDLPQTILIGGSYSCEYTVFLASDSLTAHTNVVTGTAVDDDGTQVTDDDDATVTFTDVAPEIRITKTADPTHVPETGGDVTFTFLVENIGQEDVTLTELTDTVFSDLNGQGTCAVPQTILIGGSYSCSITVWLEADDLVAHYNVSTATAVDDDGTSDTATDDETVTFDDVAPDISITKTADPTHVPETGGDVTFTFLVENIGVEDVTLTSLVDDVFGDLNGQGDCATGGLIAVGGSYSCSITAWIDGDYESGVSHHNVVTANVTDDDGTTDTDSDDETVTFTDAMASIDVEKYVSIDGGLTWEDADSATGPYLLSSGAAPRFKFVVTNTGNADLTDVDVTDNVFGNISLDGTLAVGASAEYFVTGTWATGQHTNTATATGSFVDGAGNTESDTDTDDANYFGASPSFTVAKECASIQPIPQEGPAKFTVTLENTGNVTISITADEDLFDGVDTIPAGTAFNLAVGYTKSFEVTLAGAFVGLPSADNLVSAEYTYTDSAGNARTGGGSDFAFCRVGSRVNVLKLTQGVVDPTLTWSFSLWAGADGFEGTLIATSSTNGDLDGILDFGNPNLDKNLSYTLCENEVNAGWTSFWQVDTNKDGIVDSTVIPYNPNQSDDPPADIGNRCVNFGYGTGVDLLTDGGTLLFQVNNTYPGGDPRTPGYWKNWNRVTGGGQQYTADANGGWAAGFWLLEDVLDPNIGGGITWDDILADGFVFQITNAKVAVDILDQRDVADPDQVFDGPKMSSDAAYTLAMHLLAAQLNFGSGARTCDAAWDAALAGEELLDKYDFQGTGSYLPNNSKDKTIKADYAKAIGIANTLDLYNNGDLCTGPMVSFEEPLDNDVVSGAAVDLVVNVIDMVPVMQVEFFVDEASIGVDSNSSDGWSMIWDSTTVTDGSHTLRAVATNGAAQTGSADVTITVDNVDDPPVVNITNPSDGAKLSGSSVSITADAYDAGGVTYVEFFVEGASIGIDYDDSDGWSATWDLTGVADGTYTLSATATDNGGMTADHSITVTVDNVPDPKVKVASLTPSSAWTNPVTWQATVEITIDPALAGAEVTAVWNGTVTASCTTGGDGTCSIKLSNLSKKLGSVTFNVTNITLAGYEFDPSGPITVTVNKP